MLVEHVAVIEAGAVLDLFVVGIDVAADGFRRSEIKGGVLHKSYLTSGNGRRINGEIEVCIELQAQRFPQ